LTFPHRVLPRICLHPPKFQFAEKRSIYINPGLFLELFRLRPDAGKWPRVAWQGLVLNIAYEATIEAWTRALDLRDKEPEGHTQRVVALTVLLAKAYGVKESDLPHIQRGALLHDIGKLGIPDSVLHKTSSLCEEDWLLIRRHPQIAYDLLSPIAFLFPALDIPHYHHEKWDGTGYPYKLQAEQIPPSARIFAVADVYDALTSDHIYRKAWPKEKALEYIREQSGLYFDPRIVELFLKTV
jgi:HD-GYP domain-containing protein (c-di-GMP phosphodiesterase class II)